MQADLIKPTLKAPERLNLEYYELLSKVAFKFNLRRYHKAAAQMASAAADMTGIYGGRAVQVDSVKTCVET